MDTFWDGVLRFDRFEIPVKLVSAHQSSGIQFDALHKSCSAPASLSRSCPEHGTVPEREIALGVKIGKDRFLQVEQEDFELAAAKSAKTISIDKFVKKTAVDPYYFRDSFLLSPEQNAAQEYKILREALLNAKTFGLAEIHLEKEQCTAAIWAKENALYLTTLRPSHELVQAPKIEKPAVPTQKEKYEIQRAEEFINRHSEAAFSPEFDDVIQERLLFLLSQRIVQEESGNVFSLQIPTDLAYSDAPSSKAVDAYISQNMEKAPFLHRNEQRKAS